MKRRAGKLELRIPPGLRLARILALSCLFVLAAHPVHAQVDQTRAQAYFDEVATLCAFEGGRLWGVSLCGPMVFADPVTGEVALNAPEPDAPRPPVLGYANAALEWGQERWAIFVWPMIPEDPAIRARMMLHELFHRIQPQLGLYVDSSASENDHLDTPEGRYWMQLEWLALAAALSADGPRGDSAIRDALAFRSARRARFPGAAETERISEINEGLAQYTGTVVAATLPGRLGRDAADALGQRRAEGEHLPGAVRDALQQLADAPGNQSFVRTFAYASGSAYGLLLDARAPGWTRTIKATDDLGHLLTSAAELEPTPSAEAAALRYGGAVLRAAEQAREAERQVRITALRARFVEGPVLVVPRGQNASFITTGVTPIPDAGTIYPTFRVTGEWGSIEAEQVLMSPDGATLTVPGPISRQGSTLSGEGWIVTLEPGWEVRPGPRSGDFQVTPQSPERASQTRPVTPHSPNAPARLAGEPAVTASSGPTLGYDTMKWNLAILLALTGLASPALAQEREVTLDLTPFQAGMGYAREVRPGMLAGGEAGLGLPFLNLTLVPRGEGNEKVPDFGELLHAAAFVRHRAGPRVAVDAGVRASLGGVWPCRVSDCWPSPFVGAYLQPTLTWRRVSFGSRLTAGWIGESWEEGSAGTTFVVGLSPFIVRLTFR